MNKARLASVKEVTERFFFLEEEMGLFERKIAGESFWELVRSRTYREILGTTGIFRKKQSLRRRSLQDVLQAGLHAAHNTLFHNPLFAPRSDILFFGMNRRRLHADGLWYDIYCDPFIEALEKEGMRCSMVERPHFGSPNPRPAKTRFLYYLDSFELCFLAARLLGIGRARFTKEELVFLKELQERLEKEFDVYINIRLQLEGALRQEKIFSFLYGLLLKKVAPRAVIAADLFGKRPLIRSCRKAGVPLIEIHQGAIHRYSLEYSFEGPARKKERVPDYFLVFGEFWRRTTALPLAPERVKIGGFPYYEQQLQEYKNTPKKNQIVFLSQPTSSGIMARFALELAKELGEEWRVVYKLHPEETVDWKERYPELVNSSVDVLRDDQKPLYQLLAESRVQVGTYTTVLYEGLGFGLRTFLLAAPESEMTHLAEEGYATKVASPRELHRLLKMQGEEKIGAGDDFFQSGALPRMVRHIKEIIAAP